MADQSWKISGEYMESCNCDYLCPCIYTNPQGPATHDDCTALMVYRIDHGAYGTTRLDGLHFALVIRSGKVMADGDWVFAVVVDAAADAAQRAALGAIASGEAGGPPGAIRAALVSDFRGVTVAPVRFEIDGLRRRADIPGVLSFEIEGVASRNKSGRAALHRQHGASGQPAAGAGAREGDAGARIRPRSGDDRPGQQRALRAVLMGGIATGTSTRGGTPPRRCCCASASPSSPRWAA